jgi:hypothetical protein
MAAPAFHSAHGAVTRAEWGAGPLPDSVGRVTWPPGVTLWVHHSAGITARAAGPGMPGPKWLAMLVHPARHPARTVARIRAQRAIALAARTQTIDAEMKGMRAIDRLHRANGWPGGVGYGWVVWPSGRAYTGRGFGRRGTHRPGANSEPSVCLALNGQTTDPSPAAVRTVWAIARDVDAGRLRGHGDGYPTACPGTRVTAAFSLPRTIVKRKGENP